MSGQNNQPNDPIDQLIQAGVEVVADEIEHEQNGHHQPTHEEQIEAYKAETRYLRRRSIVWGAVTVLFVAGLAVVFGLESTLADWSWSGTLPRDANSAAQKVLAISPIIVRTSGLTTDELNAECSGNRMVTLVCQCRSPLMNWFLNVPSSDLPILVRGAYANNVTAVDLESPMPGHVDIPRLRTGKVGGFFWCVI